MTAQHQAMQMFEDKLRSLLAQKAAAINLPYNDIDIVQLNPEVGDEFVYSGAEMFVDMRDGRIILEAGNLTAVPDNELEVMIEHEIGHCADTLEGFYGDEVFALGIPIVKVLAQEMYQSFTEYFASQRQIREFGPARFQKYQMRGLADFVKRMDDAVRQSPNPEVRIPAIAALYKEQIKCNFLDEDAAIIPSVIRHLVYPFPESFERIHRTGLDWISKSKLLYLMDAVHFGNVDMIGSYLNGHLIARNGLREGTASSFRQAGILTTQTYDVGLEVERAMLAGYKSLLI